MRISKEDWHQDFCDEQCDRLYCKWHRLIYQSCQSGKAFRTYDEWGPSVEIDGSGECVKCRDDYEIERIKKHWEMAQRIRQINERGAA